MLNTEGVTLNAVIGFRCRIFAYFDSRNHRYEKNTCRTAAF